jgi:hypothetical protein
MNDKHPPVAAEDMPMPEEAVAPDRATPDAEAESDWLDTIDPETADFARTKGWEDLNAVIRSYQNLESMLGSDRAGRTVVLPGDENDTEALNDIYDRLGRPEVADGYELQREDAPADDRMLGWFRGVAHEAGLSQRQARALFDAWGTMATERIAEARQSAQSAAEHGVEALRAQWGARFDSRMVAAERASRRFGPDGAKALQASLGYAPVMDFLARIGDALGEDTLPVGEGRSGFGLSPEEARSSYDQRKRDPDFIAALQDAGHPGHAAASAERARYLSAIWPNR